MKVNANEIKFLLLFFGCKTSPLHCQMGTQSADIQHLSTDYTSIGKKLQQCVNHVSMCPLRWCFIFIWLCISTIQPWSNIKVSQPVRWLVISHCVIWRLRVCVCVCGAGTAIIASKQPFICGRRICAVRQITPQKDSHGETEIIEFIHFHNTRISTQSLRSGKQRHNRLHVSDEAQLRLMIQSGHHWSSSLLRRSWQIWIEYIYPWLMFRKLNERKLVSYSK